MATITVTLVKDCWIAGVKQTAGSSVTIERSLAGELITNGIAAKPSNWESSVSGGSEVFAEVNSTGRISIIAGGQDITDLLVGDVPVMDAGGSDFQRPLCSDGMGDIVVSFDSTAGWAANGTGSPTLTQDHTGFNASGDRTGIVSRTGCPAMLKVVATTANDEIQSTTINASTGGKFGIWVYLANQPGYEPAGVLPSGGAAVKFSMLLSTSASSFSNGLSVVFDHMWLREGWNFLVFNDLASTQRGGPGHPAGITRTMNGDGSNGDIVNNAIRRAKIILTNMQGGPEIYFDSVWSNFSTRPRFVLGTDSQGDDMMTIMLPMFEKNGWLQKSYMAVPRQVLSAGDTTNFYYKSWSAQKTNIDEAYSAGMFCIPHSTNHQKPGDLTSAARVRWEVLPCQAWLASHGWVKGSDLWVSPNFSTSRLSEKVIKDMGFIGQRHGRATHTIITPFGIDNPHHIGSLDIGLTTLQKFSLVKTQIDIAIAYGASLWLFHHSIQTLGDPGTGEGLTGDSLLIYQSNYTMIHDYIRQLETSGSLDVVSPYEFFKGAR